MAKQYEHPDAAWDLAADIFTETRRSGRPRADDRLMLNGTLWVLCSGAAWSDMPGCFGRGRNGSHLPPPPHRSVRAELPHTAPALGFDAEAGYGIRMHS